MRERRVGVAAGFPIILEKEVESFNARKRAEKKLLFEHNSHITGFEGPITSDQTAHNHDDDGQQAANFENKRQQEFTQ